ncbi:MAG: pyridoxal phosphate-dependent aminotransferase [Betaproteobacteria bacterium]|nr:pyridoxal phosphate-dependent aminotransferase [Betaproteobacteria bacterium]
MSPAARVTEISPFQVMEVQTAARALEAAGVSVIHLEIGEPDFPTPEPVLREARLALASGDLYYTSALGIAPLREAIAGWYSTHFGIVVEPERVVVTAGSSAALLLVMALLVDRDDEVLMADPGYPCNRHFVRVLEGRARGVAVGPDTAYQLTPELVAKNWTPHTRAVLIATPSNPTGTQVSPQALREIAEVVAQRGGELIVDEIYLGLSYGERPPSALGSLDRAYVINSFSKYFNMTGWRLGWLVAPRAEVRNLEKLAQNLYISPATVSQRAALACFRPETIAIVEARRREFQARRDLLLPALRDLGFGIPVTPTGGFFIYADCSRFSRDSMKFCRDLLQETGVAITPGADFGSFRAGEHLRIAYTIAEDKLQDGLARLRRYLGTPGSPPK